jgi:magnesium-transporting ATPase (P-type)
MEKTPLIIDPHQVGAAELVGTLGSDPAHGLTGAEAVRRLAAFGPNELPAEAHKPWWRIVLRQFASPLIYILFVAAVISLALGHASDAVVILVVVGLNAVIGALQEGRAEHSMNALRKLSALRVRVIRDGREEMVEARDLVPGDLLLIAAGDAVGADARLLEAASLEATEAALTGESLPVAKHAREVAAEAVLAERGNMIHAGTHLTAGRGRAVVVATGLRTEVGKIARMTTTAGDPATPLEQRLQQFGQWLVAAAVFLFGVVVAIGLARGIPFASIFMVAISQMVSMVPEGLPVAMTIALAVGMQRMARRGAIIRRLAAVETLGSTSIICSDKTGTLTKNEMTVVALLLPDGRRLQVTGAGYAPGGRILSDGEEVVASEEAPLRALLEAMVLCNDAQLVPPDATDARWRALGDPTEAALLTAALKGAVDPEVLRGHRPRRAEIPFDADAKMMATKHEADGHASVLYKGAPEQIIELCDLGAVEQKSFREAADALGAEALRVLAFAAMDDPGWDPGAGLDQGCGRLRFLGLVGQMDPPRDEVTAAVTACRHAGIRPVMVTGDHKATGLAIARTLGIARDGEVAVDGVELEMMPEHELRSRLGSISVFARVHPAQKLRIVEAFQSQGHVVAMTGDGVNDAPALATADVGVAMGLTGTEVAKGASKIIISDDNFATIVRAVEEGRLVYQNLKKVILYLLATSMAEVLVLLLALLAGLPLPLAAVQILWINIVTEGTVTVNLIMEPLEGDEMRRRPTRPGETLLSGDVLRRMALMTPVMVASTLGFFVWRLSTGVPFALVQTETFTVLAVCQWFNVLNCRSATQSVFKLDLLRNKWLIGGLLLGNLLHVLVVYAPPLNRIFHTVPIPLADFFLLGVIASAVLWAEEIRKWRVRRRRREAAPRVA